tara:strand:- start:93 stop:308 length:216 start_codon:yes stop_codon:yes gene_type:complete
MISRDTIEVRKNIIIEDIEAVRQRLTANEQKKIEDTALLNALTGAFQQCELFLKEFDNDQPEMASDGGNEP